MRQHLIFATTVLAIAPSLATAEHLMLDYSRPVAGITRVVLDAGVGEVEVIGDSSTTITASVDVSQKGSRFWSRRDESLAGLEIQPELDGATLRLRLGKGARGDHSWGEEWTVHLPRELAVEVELGVGEVRVLDVAGDITVEVGVGDVSVEGEDAKFGRVRASSGVGDASLRTPREHEDGEGFIGHSLQSRGSGQSEISVSAGVGDTRIRLR